MRVDVPTLKCDRCGVTTQSKAEMARFSRIEAPHMSGTDEWDLCPGCRVSLDAFMGPTGEQ